MTVIAWDGETLAADGLATYGDSIGSTRQQKIFRASDYMLEGWDMLGHQVLAFAVTGLMGAEQVLISVLNDSLHQDVELGAHLSFTAFLVLDNTETWICAKRQGERGIDLYRVDMPHFALGCGADAALGALLSGRSAIDAVAIAMEVNVYCGGDIQAWTPRIVPLCDPMRYDHDKAKSLWLLDGGMYADPQG